MIDWHASLSILAVFLGLGLVVLVWVLWDTITNVILAGAVLLAVRLVATVSTPFRRSGQLKKDNQLPETQCNSSIPPPE